MGIRIENTISLWQVIQLVVLSFALAGAYYSLERRISLLENNLEHVNTLQETNVEALRNDVRDIKDLLKQMNPIQPYSSER